MGRIRYYHVPLTAFYSHMPLTALYRLPPRLRDWPLHTLTPEEAHERYGVFVKVVEDEDEDEDEDGMPLSRLITWLPAFPGVIGKAHGFLVFRLPEGSWLTEEQWALALLPWWRTHRLTYAVQWAVLHELAKSRTHNPAIDP